nr:MAG TPA: hypothetical protein [Caudoviricetes sp.]
MRLIHRLIHRSLLQSKKPHKHTNENNRILLIIKIKMENLRNHLKA